MKRSFLFLIAAALLSTPLAAQVGKEMKAFRGREGVTVTLLTPSLFSLYKKENAGRLPDDVLRQLKEVNVLRADLRHADPALAGEIKRRVSPILENEAKYDPVSNRQSLVGEERLYVSRHEEEISALVLWSASEEELVLVELKGAIQPRRVYLLPSLLQVDGLERLAHLAAPGDDPLAIDPFDLEHFFPSTSGALIDSLRRGAFPDGHGDPFGGIDAMIGQIEQMFEQLGRGSGVGTSFSSSRGLEVIRENGKTRIKVDASNVEILYLIDGKVIPADSLASLPDEIAHVEMLDAPDAPGKAYVLVNTLQKTGQFISFSGGILRYRHGNQDYTCNVERLPEPALVINNRLSREFRVNPADIIQIRPATDLERTLLGLPSAQVVIVTR
jgi:hypothetical protein